MPALLFALLNPQHEVVRVEVAAEAAMPERVAREIAKVPDVGDFGPLLIVFRSVAA